MPSDLVVMSPFLPVVRRGPAAPACLQLLQVVSCLVVRVRPGTEVQAAVREGH